MKKNNNPEYLIHICDRDNLYMVIRRSERTPHVYRTVAEAYTREAAEILYHELVKIRCL